MRRLLLLLLLTATPVEAGDLGMAGAISGAGQGLSNALATIQAGEVQRQLMEERHRLEMDRLEREQAKWMEEDDQIQKAYRVLRAERQTMDTERAQMRVEPDAAKYEAWVRAFNERVDDYNARLQRLDRRATLHYAQILQ